MNAIVQEVEVTPATERSMKFNEAFDRVTTTIEYNPAWANGTGYFDDAVREGNEISVKLTAGEMAKSITPMPNNRKLIFVGTPLGTFVVFERYTDGQKGAFVFNAPRRLKKFFLADDALSCEDIERLLGDEYGCVKNYGKWLADLQTEFKKM